MMVVAASLPPDDGPAVLPDAAARRLANQLARAFHGTYGAPTGLRVIVRAVARQMLVAGSSEAAVARTFERCVMNHPACPADSKSLTDMAQPRMLVALTQQCVAEVAQETLHSSGAR
jgi:hypothetical protein